MAENKEYFQATPVCSFFFTAIIVHSPAFSLDLCSFFCISVHHDNDDNNQNSASNKPLAKLYKVLNNQGQKLVPNHTITDLITG